MGNFTTSMVSKRNRFSMKFFGILVLVVLVSGKSWGVNIFTVAGGGTLPTDWAATNNILANVIDKSTYYLLDPGNPGDILTTKNYDLSSYTTAEFKVDITSFGSGSYTPLKVEVSYNGGTSYTQTATTDITTGSYLTKTVSLNSISSQVKLRLSVGVTSGRGIRLQNLILNATSTATPDILLADNGTQVAIANVNQAASAVVLHKFQLGVTTAAASLTGMTCTTNGTYAVADITNLKVRYSVDATLEAGDATLSTYTNPGAAGAKTFPSFTSQSIASGSTGYIFITADVAAGATHNNAIGIDAITTSNLTFGSGNKTGSTTSGGTQTFKDVTAPTVSSYSPTDGNTAVTANQNLILTFSENVKAGTGGTFDIYSSAGLLESIPYNDSRITYSTNTVTINPTATFTLGSNYYVNISANAVSDNQDNAYAGISNNTTWNFTTVAPSVTNVTSTNADGTYKLGDAINVTVTFTDNVVVTGFPYVYLNMVGTDRQAAYVSGSGTNSLVFSYTLQDTDGATDLDYVNNSALYLNSGTINSADGVAVTRTLATPGAAGSLGNNKAIVVDCVKPTVSSYNPTDGNTTVTINQNLVLTFNENVKVGSSGNIVIYTTGATVFETIPYNDSRITFSTNTVTINPTSTFGYSSDYYVQTTGNPILDMYDNAYVGIGVATTWNFTTECGPVSLPYSQDFSTFLPNTCWTQKTGLLAAPSTLTGTSSTWTSGNYANGASSSASATINIYGTTAKEWLITPTIDLGSTTDYQLEFDLALTAFGATTNPATTGTDDKFAVVISTDNGITWSSANTLRVWNNSGSSDVYNSLTPAGTHITISLANYTGQVKIGFYGESTGSNADNDLFIDNLSVVQLATCITPTVVSSSSVTSTTATISWVASSSNPTNGYQYELRTSGAAGSGATGLITSGTTAAGVVSKVITDLLPSTSYNVYVRSDCGASDYSAWTSAYNFTSSELDATVANTASSINGTGFTASWSAVSGASGYKIDVGTSFGSILLTQDFETVTFPPTGWASTGFTRSTTGSDIKNGIAAATGSSNNGTLTTSSVANPTTLSFYLGRSTNATAKTLKVNISTTSQSTGFTTIATFNHTNVTEGTYDQYTVDLSAYSGQSTVYVQFEKVSTTTSPWRLDDIVIEKQSSFVSGYNNLSVSSTTQEVSGLTPNTTYYYRVRAVGGNSTSANSNTITAVTTSTIPVASGEVNASTLPVCTTCDVEVANGATLTVNASKEYNSVTVAPGGKLTLANGSTLTAPITLQSTSDGTATFIDRNTGTPQTVSATVYQLLSATRNWYISSPVSTATSPTTNITRYYEYIEPGNNGDLSITGSTAYWKGYNVGHSMTVGKGYIAQTSASTTIDFSGNLNNNNEYPIVVSRTGSASRAGYNLIGNPYMGYLDWKQVIDDPENSGKIETSKWYRTYNNSDAYTFSTHNGTSGQTVTGTAKTDITKFIPPMQAFWVRVKSNLSGEQTIKLKKTMLEHRDTPNNKFKAPDNDNQVLVRLQVSNGNSTDEALVYFNPNASNSYDDFDSYKMFNSTNSLPELYTIAGGEKLVINGFRSVKDVTELPIGFVTLQANNFSIKATEIKNFDSETQIVLKDKLQNAEFNLTSGEGYEFSSVAVNDASRFSIIFRTSGSANGLDNKKLNTSTSVFVNANGELVVKTSAPLSADANVAVFNAVGQQVSLQPITSGMSIANVARTAGIYWVKLTSDGESIMRKVVVK